MPTSYRRNVCFCLFFFFFFWGSSNRLVIWIGGLVARAGVPFTLYKRQGLNHQLGRTGSIGVPFASKSEAIRVPRSRMRAYTTTHMICFLKYVDATKRKQEGPSSPASRRRRAPASPPRRMPRRPTGSPSARLSATQKTLALGNTRNGPVVFFDGTVVWSWFKGTSTGHRPFVGPYNSTHVQAGSNKWVPFGCYLIVL